MIMILLFNAFDEKMFRGRGHINGRDFHILVDILLFLVLNESQINLLLFEYNSINNFYIVDMQMELLRQNIS